MTTLVIFGVYILAGFIILCMVAYFKPDEIVCSSKLDGDESISYNYVMFTVVFWLFLIVLGAFEALLRTLIKKGTNRKKSDV